MLLLILSSNAFAFNSNHAILNGNSETIINAIKSIDKYTPIMNEKTEFLTKNNKDDSISFLQKPEIVTTKTRDEIDAEKKQEQKELAQKNRTVVAREKTVRITDQSNAQIISQPQPRVNNGYWYGFCTWYAAEKRPDVPNHWGNAKSWLSSAQRDGRSTGRDPQVGAIMVTSESWAGHVAYVESIDGNQVTVSEMNYKGWSRISTRTLDINDRVIRGYIY